MALVMFGLMGWEVIYQENVVLGNGATAEEAVSDYLEVRPALVKICMDNGGDHLTMPDMTLSPQMINNDGWHIGTEFCVKPLSTQLSQI